MNKQQLLKKITDLINDFEADKKLAFEDHNFRINSDGWKKITVDHKEYLENDTKDVWEMLEDFPGEQLFTWDAAMRETQKAGKTIPNEKNFDELLTTKSDMPKLLLVGERETNGTFANTGAYGNFWSSLQSGANAWYRNLDSGYATVFRATNSKAYGFSVRTLK